MNHEALVRHQPKEAIAEAFHFTADQRKVILDICCGGANPQEATSLLAIAEMRGLNPLMQECYFVQRWDGNRQRKVWAVQISIDAMRIKAEESGSYAGQDETEFEYEGDSKVPSLARVRVYRRDWDRPCVGVARYSEYVQKKQDGTPTRFWADMPHNQLAKCAEALALRKAFPRRLAKLYTADEMAQSNNDAPHEELTGEVVPQVAPSPQVAPPAPPPTILPDAKAFYGLKLGIEAAKDELTLKAAWADVLSATRAQRITLSQRSSLMLVKDERKKAMMAPVPVAETLAGNEFDSSFEGPTATPTVLCLVCQAPIVGARIQTWTADGEEAWRHTGCSPLGLREPGEEG